MEDLEISTLNVFKCMFQTDPQSLYQLKSITIWLQGSGGLFLHSFSNTGIINFLKSFGNFGRKCYLVVD